MEATLSSKLAHFIEQIRYDDFPRDVTEMAKDCLLDWLGCVYAARSELPVKSMAEMAKLSKGKEHSTIIPYGEMNSAPFAALVNGAASHALEFDDVHRDSVVHPATVIISAVFAVGERERISGKSLIEAIVTGYEVMTRVGEAVGRSHYRFWHNTSTCGTFGSAAAAGKILGLTQDQYVYAFGNAGSQSSGLWEFLSDGADTSLLHTGKAAMNGIIAADLAKLNFTGARKIFEGEKGFYRATSSDFDFNKLIEGLDRKPSKYRILSNSFKLYPSCRHPHSPIDASLELFSKYKLKWQDIDKVEIYTYSGSINLCGDVKLKSPYIAKWHIPFSVATAIKYGILSPKSYSDSRLKDKDLLNLTSRISLHLDPELDALYPSQWPARVEIYMKGGDKIQTTVYHPKGDPENPLTKEELISKFRDNTSGILSSEDVNRIINRINLLEDQRDLSEFLDDIELSKLDRSSPITE